MDAQSKAYIHARIGAMADELRQKGVTSLALFGSVVRGDARPDSDVDVLIDIAPEADFSLIDLMAVKCLLEDALGRPVDVVTRDGIDPAIRGTVMHEAKTVF